MQQGSVGGYAGLNPLNLEHNKTILNEFGIKGEDDGVKSNPKILPDEELAVGALEVKVKMEAPDEIPSRGVKPEPNEAPVIRTDVVPPIKADFLPEKTLLESHVKSVTSGGNFLKPHQFQTHHHTSGFHHPNPSFPLIGSNKLANFNLQNFYAAAAAATASSFHGQQQQQQQSGNNNKMNNVHGHAQPVIHHQHHQTGFRGRPPLANESYHHRFNNNFHQVNNHGNKIPTGSYPAVSYSGFQPAAIIPSPPTSAPLGFENHQNSGYRSGYPRHRKWNAPAGLRGLHPPMPVSFT